MGDSLERTQIVARLRQRREEIEEAILARVHGVAAPDSDVDPEYLYGLQAAVSAALDYAFAAIELGGERAPPIPTSLLAQARLAARHGIGLDTVVRRYVSGYTLLGDFALQEADAEFAQRGVLLHRALIGRTAQVDRLIAAVADEYRREAALRPLSGEERRVERVERLLAGELIETDDFPYDLEGWHVGLVFIGGDPKPLQQLAAELDRRLLSVRPHPETIWGWLGGRRRLEVKRVAERARKLLPDGSCLALGEPAAALAGWRLSHNQAKAVLPFARVLGGRVVRYSEFGLLASLSRDEILVRSLRDLYLVPLADERDGGEALRCTLRAYLETGRNITSTAAALEVNRETVRNRLRLAEERLGCRLDDCGAELELALKLDEHLPLDRGLVLAAHPPIWPAG